MSKTIKGHNPGFYQADNPVHVKIWSELEENRRLSSQPIGLDEKEINQLSLCAGSSLRKAFDHHLQSDLSKTSFLLLDGNPVAMAIPGTDLKDVFTYASEVLGAQIPAVLNRKLNNDTTACILHRLHASISVFLWRGKYFEIDKRNESILKCLGHSLMPGSDGMANLNAFSNSVLNWFSNTLRSKEN